jgi:hypothetical protein
MKQTPPMPGGGSSAIQSLAYVTCLFIKTIKILNVRSYRCKNAAGNQILPLYDAAGSQILPLHDAAGIQILPPHDAAGSQFRSGESSLKTSEDFPGP